MQIFQIILTIICGIGAFSVTYLLGSMRQKEKDDRELRSVKAEAETIIADAKRETAKEKADKERASAEKESILVAKDIINGDSPITDTPELKKRTLEAMSDDQLIDTMKDLIRSSVKRAEEVQK